MCIVCNMFMLKVRDFFGFVKLCVCFGFLVLYVGNVINNINVIGILYDMYCC